MVYTREGKLIGRRSKLTDGSLYGYQNSKEQFDQTGFGTTLLETSAAAKKEVTVKESWPDKTMIWLGAFGIRIVVLMVYIKYFKK